MTHDERMAHIELENKINNELIKKLLDMLGYEYEVKGTVGENEVIIKKNESSKSTSSEAVPEGNDAGTEDDQKDIQESQEEHSEFA